ncbi:amidohydrolase [Actinocorallia longicatena]|uniref:Amidohydrolase n=1 Tax=Actinocorallia longicatena TaxID=111803 RepID=A0ABP6Q963_9ACTN
MGFDVVFAGGPVFTGDPARPWATAVGIKDGTIAAVGHDEVASAEAAERVGLGGRMLLPGFQDAHAHPVAAGLQILTCDLRGADTAEGYVQLVAEYARRFPEREWIVGGGWSMDRFPPSGPTRRLLDAVVADRPVFLLNRDAHGAWANTRALELAGIGADTPDPADGRIEREPDGAPAGMLHEGAATLVGRHTPGRTPEEKDAALLVAQERLHSLGITAWQDAIIGEYLDIPDVYDTYLRAAARGTLTARVSGALWWDRNRGLEQLGDLLARRVAAGNFTARTVKIMQDGVAENYTAAMHDPYFDACGCRTANSGISFVDPAVLGEAVTALDAAGFQVHLHAIGDRAATEALDALAAARRANGTTDHRHHIAHLQVIAPGDLPRFRELGVTANMQALWACHEPQMDDLTIPFIGPERTARQYPFAALHRTGATLAAGSDWPVSSPDPWEGLHVAVNRVEPGGDHARPLLPEQSLSLHTALTAYTAGSAYVNHLDDTGVIRPGFRADLAIADRDPFAAPVEEIHLTRTVATYVGGREVFTA